MWVTIPIDSVPLPMVFVSGNQTSNSCYLTEPPSRVYSAPLSLSRWEVLRMDVSGLRNKSFILVQYPWSVPTAI